MKSLVGGKLSPKRKRVLFDTCFIVASLMKAKSRTSEALFQILNSGYIPLITSTIVKELDNKRWNLSEDIDSKTCSRWSESVWKRLIVVDDSDEKIKSTSETIPTHFPDNLHIAAAKSRNAVIISMDRKLIRTAQNLGIPASDPFVFVETLNI
jgi:rRNA-processing protein FCF1